MVIVHPAGQLDDAEAASFWTEVPAFAACSSGGATLQQAVDNTRLAISSWMSYVASREAPAPAPSARAFELVVERAF
jgi:predicted RNase H-like HicB family nuclease